jgi:signal transduction histidine kinase
MIDFMVLERKSRKSDGQGHADRDATSARVLREEKGRRDRRPPAQPGLAQLNELLDEARDVSGIGARLIASGWLTTLDPGVELSCLTHVQGALTNTRRLAPGAAVDVSLARGDAPRQRRPARPDPRRRARRSQSTPRHGLRERAAAVGGDFHAARLLPEAS